jgi:hypothetical protein
MADPRNRQAVKIVDPTTNANQAGVDASGNLQVIAAANSGVDIGDVDVTSVVPGTGATNLGKAIDTAVGGTDTGVGALAVRDDALGGITPAEGDWTSLLVDANGALWTHDDALDAALAGSELQVDVVGALPAGDNNIGNVDIVSGPTGTSALEIQGTAADGAAAAGDPVQIGGVDGSANMQSITVDTDGHLQVDVLTGGGSDTPTSPVVDHSSSTDTAAGASEDFDSTDFGGSTKKLAGIDCGANVPFKLEINQVDDDVDTLLAVLFGQAGEHIQWRPPHRNYFSATFSANGGFDGWQAKMTNMDNSQAANMYATLYSEN